MRGGQARRVLHATMWQASHRIRGVPPDKVEESRLLAPQRVPDGQNACVAGVFWYSARPFDWPPYYRDESAATYLIGYGAIAQLGERLHGMQEVDGSIPSGSTKSRVLHRIERGTHRSFVRRA